MRRQCAERQIRVDGTIPAGFSRSQMGGSRLSTFLYSTNLARSNLCYRHCGGFGHALARNALGGRNFGTPGVVQTNFVGNAAFTTYTSGATYNVVKPGEALMIRLLRLSPGQAPPPGAWPAQDITNTIGPRLKSHCYLLVSRIICRTLAGERMLRIVRKRLYPVAQLRRMHLQVFGCPRVRDPAIP